VSLDGTERRYVSQYAADTLGLIVHRLGAPADADGDNVSVRMVREDASTVFARPAEHLGTGQYGVTLTSADTSIPGNYALEFSYTVDGRPDTYSLPFQVGVVAPAYDNLAPGFKEVVEQAWVRFADLFDSPFGGPHLQVYMQANFGRQRLATLLGQAIGRLNIIAQPHMTYGLDREFPFAQWGPLLTYALNIEVIRHLVRSYTEQPEIILGTSVSRTDRRDYMQRWMQVLEIEERDYQLMLENFKMAHMGLGNVSVLVSGGAYGNYGPVALPGGAGQAAARGYYFARRYVG
jgi:hypothetical protein